MSILSKNYITQVTFETLGISGSPGVPYKPGYWAEETYTKTTWLPPWKPTAGYVVEATSANSIKLATYDEICVIPELKYLSNNFKAGLDPGEVLFQKQIISMVQYAILNKTIGKALAYLNDQSPVSAKPTYLAVWLDTAHNGYGIYKFTGFTYSDRPKFYAS